MGSNSNLVPITRDYLRQFYKEWPVSPISEECGAYQKRLDAFTLELETELKRNLKEKDLTEFRKQFEYPIPLKIDECLWRNREQIEEMLDLLSEDKHHLKKACDGSRVVAKKWDATIEQFREDVKNSLESYVGYSAQAMEKVKGIMEMFIPQDWRASMVKKAQERGERKKNAEVEKLISSGGSIKAKYELYWKQQMDRREQLVAIGNASGIYKFVIRYIGGIPEVLLEFIRKVNHDKGPMEETRLVYGPPIYSLLEHALRLRSFVALLMRRDVFNGLCETIPPVPTPDDGENLQLRAEGLFFQALSLMAEGSALYVRETNLYITRLTEVFQSSPFFISAEDAAAAGVPSLAAQNGGGSDKSIFLDRSVVVPSRESRIVAHTVKEQDVPCMIAWGFRVESKDVIYSIVYIREKVKDVISKGSKVHAGREESGLIEVSKPGKYGILFDNSYSRMTKKSIKYMLCVQEEGGNVDDAPVVDEEPDDDDSVESDEAGDGDGVSEPIVSDEESSSSEEE